MSDTDSGLDRLQDLLNALPLERDGMTWHRHRQDGGIWLAGDRDRR